MGEYIGLDVSLKETAVSMRRDGKRVWRGKCASDPQLLAAFDYDGHISRRGDSHLRGLLYEAATVLLVRSRPECHLRKWGLQLRERLGFKRAAAAAPRKLAVIMHTMLITGEPFRETHATV